MPLSGLTTGVLSWRRLGVLVRGLPRDSATFVAVNGDEFEWAPGDYLLANVVDLVAWSNYQRAGGKGPKPKPMPRPGRRPDRVGERFGGTALPLSELKEALDNWSDEGGDDRGDRTGHGVRQPDGVGEGPGEVDQPGAERPAGG